MFPMPSGDLFSKHVLNLFVSQAPPAGLERWSQAPRQTLREGERLSPLLEHAQDNGALCPVSFSRVPQSGESALTF